MTSVVNSDVLRLVARLVLGYLDEQHLPEAHNVFCETSRHLTKEYLAYQEGTKSVDTSIGLVNIIAEYFLLKEKLNEFIRTCPKTSFVIQLIDASSIQLRFELIFKVLKENLLKFDEELPCTAKRKRRTETDFNISQTNTSTPETNHEPASKRRRISLPNPFVALSACNSEKKSSSNNDKSALNRKELNYISSPDTSNKEEDDVTDEEAKIEKIPLKEVPSKMAPPPELLSETFLRKPDFVETLAELINKTRSAKETESPQLSTSQNVLTQTDVQDILSKTEHENDFEDILKEVIDKYLEPTGDGSRSNDVQSTSSSPSKDEEKPEEIPIKQRLRPRSSMKAQPPSEKKKKQPKINILSNEVYTGPLPVCLNLPPSTDPIASQPHTLEPLIVSLVPIMQSTFIPLHPAIPTTSSVQIITTNGHTENSENLALIKETQEAQIVVTELDKENKPSEKTQHTPKLPVNASFLESKCKSTPRRKATHVRILDFNHTPSAPRLSSIKEFSTPLCGIRTETPGSAPASISVQTQKIKQIKPSEESIEIVDDSSNSTSISNTPKVAKNRRRRKIEIDSKKNEESPSKEPPITLEDWERMRAQQKSLTVDERMRLLFQQTEGKVAHDRKRRKTPKKKKLLNSAKKSSGSEDQLKAKELQTQIVKKVASRINGGGAKFKVTSPRKAALLRKTPKKKKLLKSPLVSVRSILTPNIDVVKQKKEEKPPTPPPMAVIEEKIEIVIEEPEKSENSLNRSDTVQEVATLLTHLPETILAKTSSGSNFDEKNKIDPQILMETPLKLECNVSPLPNTPRFAIPIVSTSLQETPIPKSITALAAEIESISAIPSLMKVCDILTPSFPITPGLKETPLKSDHSPTSASGYSSRRTDYSSCSSYYKPDESEEINQNFETIIKQAKGRNSQSESDGGTVTVTTEIEKVVKIRVGSAKKIDCPGAIDRLSSFTEEHKEIPIPHYTMMDEGLLSESILTTASDSDSSSSFTCSTCSTDPSTDDNTMEMLNQSDLPEDNDREWKCEHVEVNESNNSLVDERTGEIRFPLRNLMTPRKMEQEIKEIIATVKESPQTEPPKSRISDLEAIKQRTLRIIKNESAAATNSKKVPLKLKKANAKTFKLPPEQPKTVPVSRREQILSQNLTERSRPTPLKLIPSSSSRRKNATPRKTIIIDELPKAPSPIKKTRLKKKSESSTAKSPAKPERVSLENISDNAVMHDDHPSLNISSSFHNESSEDEIEQEGTSKTVIKNIAAEKKDDDGSNTFQQAMISQGFDKKEAKDLEAKFNEEKLSELQTKDDEIKDVEEGELSGSESEDEGDECALALSDATEKFIFSFEESSGEKIKKSYASLSKCPPSKLQFDDKTVKIDFTATMDIFSMDPEPQSKEVEKKKTSSKGKNRPKSSSSKESTTESTILNNDHNMIDKILSMLHGSK